MRNSMHKKASGFTLMELLVVMVIIGILAGLLLPVLGRAKLAAKVKKARLEAGQLETALRSYYLDNRGWNTLNSGDTSSGFVNELNGSGGKVPYLELNKASVDGGGNMVDPWGNKYKVVLCDANNQCAGPNGILYRVCAIWSLGPNGKPDGIETDPDYDDIVSWK